MPLLVLCLLLVGWEMILEAQLMVPVLYFSLEVLFQVYLTQSIPSNLFVDSPEGCAMVIGSICEVPLSSKFNHVQM